MKVLLLNLSNVHFLGMHTNMNRSCSEDPATDFSMGFALDAV